MRTSISISAYLNSWQKEALQEKAELSFDMHIWGNQRRIT